MIPSAFLLAAGFYAYTISLALNREQRSVCDEAALTKGLIVNLMQSHLHLAKAWAFLDSTNLFMRDRYPEYGDIVMHRDFFQGLGINLFTIYDLQGNKKLERFYFHDTALQADTDFDIADELQPVIRRAIARSNIFRRGSGAEGYSYSTDPGMSGFMQINGIWFFISAVPIAPLENDEQPSGILVMGKALSRNELIPLIEIHGNERFTLHTIDEGTTAEERQLELFRQGFSFDYDDSGHVYGYQIIESLYGKDLLLKVQRDRWLVEETTRIIAQASVLIFLSAVAVLAFFVIAVDKLLLRKLHTLAEVVENIEDPSTSVELPAFDSFELSSLVGALNALLQRIAANQETVWEQNQALIFASRHDTLTGLGNLEMFRLKMMEAARKANDSGGKFAVMTLSINDFRQINEMLGHIAGDEVLTYFAARLRTIFNERALPCRTGGCDYSLILQNYASHGSLIVDALQLISNCKQPITIGNRELHPSVSIGIALYPDDTDNISKLEQYVDLALNEAQKKSPASRYHFFRPKLYERISDQLFQENNIAKALSRGEFDVYLQPKLNLATNIVREAEALVRWISREGIVPPGKFIPMAETSGLIVPLSWTVIDRACLYARRLHNDGVLDFNIAVNISSQVLHNSEFIQRVKQTLDKYALDGRSLNIELTEDVLIEDAENSCRIMNDLRDLGVQISIDDFGTGYSSLQYLHKMPFDWIKIDKTFIDGLPKERSSLAIIDASREIARSMGMGVVFEGVETLQQWNAVSQMQNQKSFEDQIQGYIVSKPLPFGQFIKALKSWRGPYGPGWNAFSQQVR